MWTSDRDGTANNAGICALLPPFAPNGLANMCQPFKCKDQTKWTRADGRMGTTVPRQPGPLREQATTIPHTAL